MSGHPPFLLWGIPIRRREYGLRTVESFPSLQFLGLIERVDKGSAQEGDARARMISFETFLEQRKHVGRTAVEPDL